MSTKHADSQPSHESKNNADQQVPGQTSQEQGPNLFAISDFSQRTPAQILHLQRTVGNAKTKQILSQQMPRTAHRIQRDPSKVGVALTSTGLKVTREKIHKFPERSFGYATVAVEAGVTVDGEISWSESSSSVGGESKGGNEHALKAKVGIWEANGVEAEKSDVWKAVWEDHFKVQKADLEFDLPKNASEGKDNNTTTMGVALIVTTASGDEHKLFLNVFESKVNGAESSIIGPHGGGEIAINLVPPMLGKIALAEGLNFVGTLKGKGTVTVRPNWTAIAAKAAQRYGPAFLGQALRGAAASGGWVASGLIGGGMATIVGYYEFMQEIGELRQLRRDVEAAVPGYATGFMTGIGASGYSGGDAGWAAYGQGRGYAAFAKGLQDMKTRLAQLAQTHNLDASTITDEELTEIFKASIQKNAEKIYSQLYNAVKTPIGVLHYNKYKETHDLDTRGDEMHARAFAGVPADGPLPDPFQQTEVPMETPGGGSAAMPGDNSAGDDSGGGTSEPTNSHSSTPDWKFSDPEVQEQLKDNAAQQQNAGGNNAGAQKTGGNNAGGSAGQNHTASQTKAPDSAEEATQQDSTPTPYANNASGRSDNEQAEAEEEERQKREEYERQQSGQ